MTLSRDSETPPILALVTGNRPGHWSTLRSFLVDHIVPSFPTETQGLLVRLEQPHDHQHYKNLLNSTWCYLGRIKGQVKGGFSCETKQSQTEVLARAVQALGRVKNCKNVLCYEKANNSKTMTSPAWELLLSRIGDTLMLHLLLNVSMFATLENGCYFQLSGEPVVADARATKRASVYDSAAEFEVAGEIRRESRPAGTLVEGFGQTSGKKRARVPRLPKWKRERLKRQAADTPYISEMIKMETDVQSSGMQNSGVLNSRVQSSDMQNSDMQISGVQISGVQNNGKQNSGVQNNGVQNSRKQNSGVQNNGVQNNGTQNASRKLFRVSHFGGKMLSPSEMQIHRHAMFYKQLHSRRCGLSKRHILMQLDKESQNSGIVLHRCIFSPALNPVARKYNHLKAMPVPRPPKRFPWKDRFMIPLLSRMVRNCQVAQKSMGKLLELHCPLPSGISRGRKRKRGFDPSETSDQKPDDVWSLYQPVPHRQVSAFIWSVVRRIVPKGLMGGAKARRVMRRNVTEFVRLKRFESITVHKLLQKLPLTDIPWLRAQSKRGMSNPNQQGKQIKTAALWIGWLFAGLVVPLLRTHFYCTENESFRQETFYYRKPVWSRMVEEALKDTLTATFVPVKRKEAREALESRKLGVARLRFLPKKSGMRFLMNMSKPTTAKFKNSKEMLKFSPINQRLKLTLNVLQCEARRQPEAFGSSTYGFNDIFCRYKPFLKKWKNDRIKAIQVGGSTRGTEVPHAVCIDVSKAFDNVDIDTLLGICSSLLTSEKYTILKFTEIMTVMGKVKVNHRRVAVPSHEVSTGHFTQSAAGLANGQRNRIFLDCVTDETITRAHVMKVLNQYLSMNLVWLKKKWRRQSKGIAQGAKPSTLLCSLYLGYVERVCLNPLIASCGGSSLGGSLGRQNTCPDSSHSLLLRMVDDWLLISRHKRVVEQFASKVIEGIPGFNIVVNPSKTQTTCPLETSRADGALIKPDLVTEEDGAQFIKWCGLLIDVETLELRADYTRYSGTHMKTTVNIPVARKPGLTLGSKICHYIRPKILPILLDQDINSKFTVRLNVYQIFLLGAMKLHCILGSLPQPPSKGSPCNWVVSAIDVGIKYMIQSTRPKLILRSSANTSSATCNPALPHAHIEYLALHAFHRILSRKHSRYPDILRALEERMGSRKLRKCVEHLEEVVLEAHSAVFRSIIY
jgi:telomerase reverse transcriptase